MVLVNKKLPVAVLAGSKQPRFKNSFIMNSSSQTVSVAGFKKTDNITKKMREKNRSILCGRNERSVKESLLSKSIPHFP